MNNPLVIDVSDRSEVTFWCYVVEGDEVTISATPVDASAEYSVGGWTGTDGGKNHDIWSTDFGLNDPAIATRTGYFPITLGSFVNVKTVTVTFPREQNVSTEVDSNLTGVRVGGTSVSKELNVVAAALPQYPVSITVPDGLDVSSLAVANSTSRLAGTTGHTLLVSTATGSYSMWYPDGSSVADPARIEGQFSDGVDFSSVSMAAYSSSVADNLELTRETKDVSDNEDYTLTGDMIVPIEKDIVWECESGVAAEWIQAAGTYAHPGIDYYPATVRAYELDTSGEKHLIATVVAELAPGYNWYRWTATVPWNTNYIEYDVYGYYTMPTWNVPYTGKYNSDGTDAYLSGTDNVTISQNTYSNTIQAAEIFQFGGGELLIVQEGNPDGEEAPEDADSDKLTALGGNTATPIFVFGGTMYPGTGGLYYGAGDVDEYSTFDRYQYGVLVPENGVIPVAAGTVKSDWTVSKGAVSQVALVTEDTDGDIWVYVDWEVQCFDDDGISLSLSKVSNTLTVLNIRSTGSEFTSEQKEHTVYVRPTAADTWLSFTAVVNAVGCGFVEHDSLTSSAREHTQSVALGVYGFGDSLSGSSEYVSGSDEYISQIREELDLADVEYVEGMGAGTHSNSDNGDSTGTITYSFPVAANPDLDNRKFYCWKCGCSGSSGAAATYVVLIQSADVANWYPKVSEFSVPAEGATLNIDVVYYSKITATVYDTATVELTVDPNPSTNERVWDTQVKLPDGTVSSWAIEITLAGATATYSLENPEATIGAAGGTVEFVVQATLDSTGEVSSTVETVEVEANGSTSARTITGTITAPDGTELEYTIIQAGAGVVYSLESSTGEIDQWGGEVEFTIVATSDATGEVIETLTRTATIDANPTLSARTVTGTITAPDGTELEYSVEQAAAGLIYKLVTDTLTIGAEGGLVTFEIEGYIETTGEDWNYYGPLGVYVDPNPSTESRTITGSETYDVGEFFYTIIQSGATVTYTITDGEDRTIGALGGTLEFTVEGVNDITGEVISTETYTVTVSENTSEESRTVTGTITVGDTALTWSVEQLGAGSAWLTATPDYVFLERPVAADIEIAVATENIEMDNITTSLTDAAGEAVDWLAESSRKDSGDGEFAFTFSASENTGSHARSATVTLTDAGSGESVEISVLQAPTKTSMRIYIGRERFRGAIYLGRKRLKVF